MRNSNLARAAHSGRRGVSLVMVTFSVSVVATLAASMAVVSNSAAKEQEAKRSEVAARLASEAGINDALFELNNGGTGNIGSQQVPTEQAGAEYWVVATPLGGGMISLVSTAEDNSSGSRLELVARSVLDQIFTYAAFGDEQLTMDQNTHVDSYNSNLGTYASQQVNGAGSNAYALSGGNVGSNGDITLSSNATVEGNAVPGPVSTVTTNGTSSVAGTTAPNTGVLTLEPLRIPTIASSGNWSISGSETLPSGYHRFDDFLVGSNSDLTVTGPATIVFEDFEMRSNSNFHVDASGGPVEIYVLNDFVMNKNTTIASLTNDPADIALKLNSDNVVNPSLEVELAEIGFESNSVIYGTVYAPKAIIDIDSNFELFGGIVGRQVHLDSWARVHFDESLLDPENNQHATWQGYVWRTMAYRATKSTKGYQYPSP